MFGKFGDMFKNMKDLQKLAGDKNVQKFISHPKVKSLLLDPKFQEIIKEKNMFKLMQHPEFMELMKDPEVQALIQQMNASR